MVIDNKFKIENKNDIIGLFQFEFTSINNKAYKQNQIYKVYAYTREDIELFIYQHSFDLSSSYIQYVNVNSTNVFEKTLNKFKFKSNHGNEVYTIMSTPDIISEATSSVCSDLSATLMFGSPALRGDIELFSVISNLIDTLPHVFIIDQAIMDDNALCDTYEYRDDKYICDGCDDEGLYESLLCASATDEVQPITIEAYVEYFAAMLLR